MLTFLRFPIRFVALAALALALARPAHAAPVTIDFESLPNLEVVTLQFAADDIAFSNVIVLEAFSTLNEIDFPPSSGIHSVSGIAPGAAVIDFLLPARLLGVRLTTANTALAQAFGAGDVLLDSQLVVANLGSNTNVEFVRSIPDIEYVRFAGQLSGDAFSLTLDDVVFDTAEIPEPSTLVLLAAGLIPLAIHRGRRAGAAQRDGLR